MAVFITIIRQTRVLDAGQLCPSSHVWNERPSFRIENAQLLINRMKIRHQFADLPNFNKMIT